MKKSILVALAIICSVATSTTVFAAAAESGHYVGINAGVLAPENSTYKDSFGEVDTSFKTGYTISAIAGYRAACNARLEVELGGKGFKSDKITTGAFSASYDSTVNIIDAMVSAYYDVKTKHTFGITPYVGGGIGLAHVFTSDGYALGFKVINASSDTVFAYQAGAGLTYDISKNVTIDLGYRYFGTLEAKLKTSDNTDDKASFTNHNFVVGARYNF